MNTLELFFNMSTVWTIIIGILSFNTIGTTVEFTDQGFLLIITCFFSFIIAYLVTEFSMDKLLSKIPFVEIKDDIQICRYMGMLTFLICKDEISRVHKLTLLGIIKQHELNCVYEKCICKYNFNNMLHIPLNDQSYVKKEVVFGYHNSKVYFLHLLKNIFEFLIIVTRNMNINLILMFSYFLFNSIGNYYYALFVILNLQKNKNLTTQQRVSVNRIFSMIQNKITENNESAILKKNKDGENIEAFKIDFDNIILYYHEVTNLRYNIKFSIEYSINFWNSILTRQEINSIKSNGLDFYKYTNGAELTYEKINKIYPNMFEINKLYNDYRFFVFGETNQLVDAANKPKTGTQNFNDSIFNNKSIIIIANILDRNKAIIEKISDNVYDFLGYNPTECLNQDIKLLMPNYYKQRHSAFVNNYFDTGVNYIVNRERRAYALHTLGYAIPVNIIIKLLPSLSSNIFCTSLIRDFQIEYDFILTNRQGKIEMMSKNLFGLLINNLNLFNSVDYYIHYICKEYLDELSNLHKTNYEVTDFTENISLEDKYRYTLLHFKYDVIVENILRDFKKSEATTNTAGLSNPTIKIASNKDIIRKNYRSDCLRRFSMIEKVHLHNGTKSDYLYFFKLFENINADGIVNLDELQIIDQYIKLGKELEEEQYKQRRKYRENTKKDDDFNVNIFERKHFERLDNLENKLQEDLFNDQSSVNLNPEKKKQEIFKQYLSIKKRYNKKNAYESAKYAIYGIIIFIALIMYLNIHNYAFIQANILNIFSSFISEYFNFTKVFQDLAGIKKNYITLLNIKDNLTEASYYSLSNYEEVIFNDTITSYNHFSSSLDKTFNYNFDFSTTFLKYLYALTPIQTPDYLQINSTLFQALSLLEGHIDLIKNISQIDLNSFHVQFALQNLNNKFFQILADLINLSLDSTRQMILELIQTKTAILISSIFLIFTVGAFIYSHILCYYTQQNKMIALLYGINLENCKEVLDNIKELKSSMKKYDNDSLIITTTIVNVEEKRVENDIPEITEQEEEEVDDYEEEESKKFTPNSNEIKKDKQSKTEIPRKESGKSKFKQKPTKELTEKEKKQLEKDRIEALRKKRLQRLEEINLKRHQYNKSNFSIAPKIYLSLLGKVLVIIGFTLIPFILAANLTFYDSKSTQIIDLVINSNDRQIYYMLSFINFQELISYQGTSQAEINAKVSEIQSLIDKQFENEISSNQMLYNTISGLNPNITQDFKRFYSIDFCQYSNYSGCNNFNHEAYRNKSFSYVSSLNIGIMKDMLVNNKTLSLPDKTIELIKTYYSDKKYLFMEETFDLLSMYGLEQYSLLLTNTISSFVDDYNKEILILFIAIVICLLTYQIVIVLFMRDIIRVVNVELKNIFSLMPFNVVITNGSIYELLSK